ncbi:MAG TPA: DUF4112 domain-containing protein [Thermoanaerobaculia bacterium]|nr:DUF4112 domain-containing protein [Thermoanaerobaculia bacterium]
MAPDKVHIPEVIEPDEKLPPDLVALRKFAVLMDEAVPIPGTSRRVGLDAGLGLIPFAGDIISALMSAWIIAGALRHRVPLPKVLRMVFNVALDLVVGEIPILGDIFDVAFEENMMNMRLLLAHRNRRLPPRSLAQIGAVIGVIVLFLILVGIVSIVGVVAVILWLIAQRNA